MDYFGPRSSEFGKHFLHLKLMLCVHAMSFCVHQLITIVELMLQVIDLFFFDGKFIFIDLFEGFDFHGWAGIKVRKFGASMSVRGIVWILELLIAIIEPNSALF